MRTIVLIVTFALCSCAAPRGAGTDNRDYGAKRDYRKNLHHYAVPGSPRNSHARKHNDHF